MFFDNHVWSFKFTELDVCGRPNIADAEQFLSHNYISMMDSLLTNVVSSSYKSGIYCLIIPTLQSAA